MTNNNADLATLTSVSGVMLSIADIQPIVTFIASIVAIISGIFAVRYYIKATEKIKLKQQTKSNESRTN
jgi:hypothetical protein